MAYDSNIIGLSTSYNTESVSYNMYELDSASIAIGASVPNKIRRRSVYQDENGNWVEDVKEDEGTFSTAPEIKDKYYLEHERRLEKYKTVLKPFDRAMIARNDDINAKKAELIAAVNAAVSAGCTASLPTNGATDPLVVNGIEVGIGSDIYGDSVQIKIYPNIYDSDSDSPFEDDVLRDLTENNLGKGYRNVITNNSIDAGTNYGMYYVIGSYLGSDPFLTPNSSCQSYINQINQIATEIDEIRSRPTSISKVNDLKQAKLDDELSDWAVKREKKNVQGSQTDIDSVIETLENTGL